MAFGFNMKEGKGVQKREYTPRFALFWEILFRKLWLLVKANFIYIIASFIAMFFIWFGYATVAKGEFATLKGAAFLAAGAMYLSVMGMGFIMPGLSFLTRYFARERHVWIFSDFFEQVVGNFKKGFIIFAVDTLLLHQYFITSLSLLRKYLLMSIMSAGLSSSLSIFLNSSVVKGSFMLSNEKSGSPAIK